MKEFLFVCILIVIGVMIRPVFNRVYNALADVHERCPHCGKQMSRTPSGYVCNAADCPRG